MRHQSLLLTAQVKGASAPPVKISLVNPSKGRLGNPAVSWNGAQQEIKTAAH